MRDIEGLSEMRALETRLRPGQSRVSRRNNSAPLIILSFHFQSQDRKLATFIINPFIKCTQETGGVQGLPERRGFEVQTDALPLFQLMT